MTAETCGPHSTWSSPLAAALQRFLEGKRAAGYRYRAEAQALGALDRVLSESLSPTDPVISSAIVRAFVARRGTESETTRAHRLTLIREVCRFLALDDSRTFVPAARFLGIHRRTSVPRVLSLDEGRRFLDACDTLHRRRSSPRRDLVLRTLLVLLYRQQAPLGNRLPALATYLGHVGIASTQRYLQLTEDIVADLTRRYATRFGHLLSDGGSR